MNANRVLCCLKTIAMYYYKVLTNSCLYTDQLRSANCIEIHCDTIGIAIKVSVPTTVLSHIVCCVDVLTIVVGGAFVCCHRIVQSRLEPV
jgi:hypothetical protein